MVCVQLRRSLGCGDELQVLEILCWGKQGSLPSGRFRGLCTDICSSQSPQLRDLLLLEQGSGCVTVPASRWICCLGITRGELG